MNLQIGFLALFALIGLAVSLVCGFMVGNYFSHILFITFLSTVGMAGFGFGVYSILEMKVPEFLDFLRNVSGAYVPEGEEGAEGGRGSYSEHTDVDTSTVNFDSPTSADEIRAAASGIPRKKADKFGDHIIVENIAIKNEPKLMAEAIRTMLAKDDGGGEK
ncbi:hypothetical protein EHQ27_08355 [Leptospira wolffii]|uniref:hypothetical protein n=1 Tax=Leptospira wolffii TaxID=409998 RepID=UPI00034DD03C|nr:hypothetical protein [Leptospira wolffii]TGK60116.1 hypothetical protein EHQ32_09430 [Leptospira wolffii]TGK72459.1 hypothetical protein EHQ27_08355 [Leptospira wolffii]TGK76123.1 hypothetical protein EHQ35_02180 [Leptospira wolffii]TGL30375.1 hypothetical protein EHQ57_08150 [Leptospira wolffii]